jgi:hypothetical protein
MIIRVIENLTLGHLYYSMCTVEFVFIVFHLEIEPAPVVLVVDDHTVIDHAESQNVVLGLERVLDHVALAQHHVQHHHLNMRIKGSVQRDRSG